MRHLVRNTVLVIVIIILAIASVYPPEKKLRKGKDLQGGFNVVYQVDVGSDIQGREATLDKVIQVVKDRLDPNGLLDISIVKSGSDRIEITMPLPGEESKKLREEYEAEMRKLVTGEMDRQALERAVVLPPAERAAELERLAGGSPDRLGKFRAAAEAYDAFRAANAAYEEAAAKLRELQASLRDARAKQDEVGQEFIELLEKGVKGQEEATLPLADAANAAEAEYRAKVDAVLATVISRDAVEHALTRRAGIVRVVDPDNPDVPLIVPSAREIAINQLIAKHPESEEQIRKVAAAWEKIEKSVQINDPNDLIRLLEGSGVLNFRIVIDPGELGPLEKELRERLQKFGPQNAGTDQARWFKINKIENWFKTKADYDYLQADPAGYLAARQGVVGEFYGGDYYILCSDRRGERLTERDGPRWQLKAAFPGKDRYGRDCVQFTMDPVGADLLAALTGANVGKQMAVILDDEVYTAPTINSQISNSGIIEGNFTSQEINYITRVLSHGSLAAKLSNKPISQDIIAPDKGIDNLHRGLAAGVLAFLVSAGFMVVYYFGCGLLSVIALLLNALLLVAVMAIQGAPFTLPGIAGIVLVFGMSVDANVLIYERMREEIQRGQDLKTSVRLGYEKALSAIVDGNLTTLIVCVVLGFTGTQEIKGFGITLGIGNVMTLFTQLVFTRMIFAWLVERTGVWRKASMLPLAVPAVHRAMQFNVDWMKLRWVFAGISLAMVIASIGVIVVRGNDMLDSQFRGGTKVTVKLKEEAPGQRVKKTRDEIQAEVEKAAAANPGNDVLKSLQHATIVLRNPDAQDASYSSEFQFKTTMTDPEAVQKGIIDALGPLLDAQPALSFTGSDITDPRQAPVYPIIDPTLGANIERPEVSDSVVDFIGGAAIVLDNIQPPVSVESIDSRIRQFRSQPDFSEAAGRQQQVIRLAGTDLQASSVVILVKDSSIQQFEGNDRKWAELVRDVEWPMVRTALTQTTTLANVESFSAEIAATFRAQAIIATLLSAVLIVIYIWVRFGSFRYSLATIVTAFHNCIIAVGVIGVAEIIYEATPGFASAVGLLPFRVDLTSVAAVLTVLGYAINDTIVVMDRIRETKGRLLHANRRIINESINKTMSRTLLTGGTTLAACLILYVEGGEAVRGFAYSMFIGIVVGTYASIAVAAPLVWSEGHEKPTMGGTGLQTRGASEKSENEAGLKKVATA